MIVRTILILVSAMLAATFAGAQPGVHTSASGGEVLRLIRREKLDLILPGAMRDNNVDMWIHVTRHGDPDPMAYWFGNTYGYLVFTDLGDRIERAAFGSGGSVQDIDVRGSDIFARTISSYGRGYQMAFGYGDEVYDEFTEFVAERDPQTIAVNTSEWLAEADGLSHTSYLKLVNTLGPKYAERIVSAENLITDFLVRRTVREVAEQINNPRGGPPASSGGLRAHRAGEDDDPGNHRLGAGRGLQAAPGRIRHLGPRWHPPLLHRGFRGPSLSPGRPLLDLARGLRLPAGRFLCLQRRRQLPGVRDRHQDPRLHPARGRDRPSGKHPEALRSRGGGPVDHAAHTCGSA